MDWFEISIPRWTNINSEFTCRTQCNIFQRPLRSGSAADCCEKSKKEIMVLLSVWVVCPGGLRPLKLEYKRETIGIGYRCHHSHEIDLVVFPCRKLFWIHLSLPASVSCVPPSTRTFDKSITIYRLVQFVEIDFKFQLAQHFPINFRFIVSTPRNFIIYQYYRM